ncbi:MAG: radical SAM family heme chaperone HemW, partial [Verrucomicrobia bacterium]|nr:radical SAM family heme chaperone HemW [Verrucomicrobiota bacterium]
MLAYLHIPFCHRICPYCSFYKHTPGSTSIADFIDALLVEAAHRLPGLPAPPRTLFLGGGTPSMLSPAMLRRLFEGLQRLLDFPELEEICLEANPATFDLKKARLFRSLGVTRVSLGIQSFSAQVLNTLGREHSPEQAIRSVEILREAEMPSINIDLMFSIPGQSVEDWIQTLATTIALEPHHVSAYNLTYEEDTAFFQSLLKGEMTEDPQRNNEMFFLAHQLLNDGGFAHYETSNYARPGHHSIHNQGYWQSENYLGLGPSAVSTIGHVRSKNVADTAKYVDMIRSIGHSGIEVEEL